jgi:hypothetical protein
MRILWHGIHRWEIDPELCPKLKALAQVRVCTACTLTLLHRQQCCALLRSPLPFRVPWPSFPPPFAFLRWPSLAFDCLCLPSLALASLGGSFATA